MVQQVYSKQWVGVQVELVVDEMRRSLTRRAGVDRRLPQFVGVSGFQEFAINIVVLVSSCHWHFLTNNSVATTIAEPLAAGQAQAQANMQCHDQIMPKIQSFGN